MSLPIAWRMTIRWPALVERTALSMIFTIALCGPRIAVADDPYRAAVYACLDRLLDFGTDRYGPIRTPMLMSIVDVRDDSAPRDPLLLDGNIRAEGRPGRRNPGGCDLWEDQPLLRVLHRCSDSGGPQRYREAATAYIRSFLHIAKKPNGMLAWGSHLYYDGYRDGVRDDGIGSFHEILIHPAEWDMMWTVDSEAIRTEVEGIWSLHIIDHVTGQHNRHDDGLKGFDFAFSGGCFAHAFASMYRLTREPHWLDRAKRIAEWHWGHRDPRTDLAPDAPTGGDRYDAEHCFTTVCGPHALALLRCYEVTGDPLFKDIAIAHIKAWLRCAWDDRAGLFHAALRLDGTPVPDLPKGVGYDVWMPSGYIDTWPTTMFSYEFPLIAAQACILAWELSGDPELLAGAKRWARQIRSALPPSIGRRWREEVHAAMPDAGAADGAYADGYGRAISFFVHLYRATHDPADRSTALSLADESIQKLVHRGWVKGHSGKPYYESTDGVGVLLLSWLEVSDMIAANSE